MKDILLTTVCNDEYIVGAKVMLYSMKHAPTEKFYIKVLVVPMIT